MKIFTADQIRNCDRFTIENEPVSSIHLMERAAGKCVKWILENLENDTKFYIFCGNGNNGGDGFAIARMLYQKGFDVDVFSDKSNKKFSDDSETNFLRIEEISGIRKYDFGEAETFTFEKNAVIIDAIFGSGLNKKLQDKVKKSVDYLNQLNLHKISIDIPSGLFADHNLDEHSTVFQADDTLTFQFWKRSFLHPETGKFCGKVHVLDIQLQENFITDEPSDYHVIDEDIIKSVFQPRKNFSNKGTYGKTCIAAGSFGKIGAAVLAVKSALKSGSGFTFILAPKCGYEILQTTCPEAMYIYGGEDYINHFETQEDFTLGIGPGLGTDPDTETSFLEFLKTQNRPMVLDADALNIISKKSENVKLIPENSMISPHPKEFERLFGKTENSFERLELAREKAREFNIYIILKDHHTQVVTPQKKVFYNITGNSGMAKGGSGDVLTGILTSLSAQKYSPEEAAVLGVWIHGKAGDFAAEKLSKEAMLPTDLIENIGRVFKHINQLNDRISK